MGCYRRPIFPWAAIVTSQCYGFYCSARTTAEHLSTPWQRQFTTITDCQSIDNLLDFNAIYCIFLLNNSVCMIRRNFRVGTVFVVLNKCLDLRTSVTLSVARLTRHSRRGKRFFVKSFNSLFQSAIIVGLTFLFVPALGPAAADFPLDVCLTVSRNHKVFLLYPSPPISIAVSKMSQLSVDIIATEGVYCDNVQCDNMYNETKVNLSAHSNDWSNYHTFTLQHGFTNMALLVPLSHNCNTYFVTLSLYACYPWTLPLT